jgi:hypothetical protein
VAFCEPQPPAPGTTAPQSDAVLPHYVIRAIRQGTEITLSGEILYGMAQDLRRVMEANPAAMVIHLNSPGGEVFEAREMVQLVRRRGLTTTIDQYCMSACTLVFLAGHERYLAPDAELGFHRSRAVDMGPAETDSIYRVDRDYMLSLGLPAAFVDKAFSTPSSSIWIPTDRELTAAGAITGVSDRYLAAVDPYNAEATEGFGFIGRSLDLIRTTDPESYRRLHEHLYEAMRSGSGDLEIFALLNGELGRLFGRYMSHASDELVVRYFRIFGEALTKLRAHGPDDCFFALYPEKAPHGFRFGEELSPTELGQAFDVTLSIISDGVARNAPIPSGDEFAAARDAFNQRFMANYPSAAAALSQARAPSADRAAVCQAEIDFLTAIWTLPQAQQGPLVRFMFADRTGLGADGGSVSSQARPFAIRQAK